MQPNPVLLSKKMKIHAPSTMPPNLLSREKALLSHLRFFCLFAFFAVSTQYLFYQKNTWILYQYGVQTQSYQLLYHFHTRQVNLESSSQVKESTNGEVYISSVPNAVTSYKPTRDLVHKPKQPSNGNREYSPPKIVSQFSPNGPTHTQLQ